MLVVESACTSAPKAKRSACAGLRVPPRPPRSWPPPRLLLQNQLAVGAIRAVSTLAGSRSPAEASSRPPQAGKTGVNRVNVPACAARLGRTAARAGPGTAALGQLGLPPLSHRGARGSSRSPAGHRCGILDAGDDAHRPAAHRAGLDVDVEHPLQPLRPSHRSPALGRGSVVCVGCCLGSSALAPPGLSHLRPMGSVRRGHTVEAGEIDSRFGHQRGQPRDDIQRTRRARAWCRPSRASSVGSAPARSE